MQGNVGIFIISHSSLLMERLRLPPHLGRDIQGRWGGNVREGARLSPGREM